ncbi:MAG: thiamine ABC transporter substrate-binding protein [Actinomycetota bacterium]|nr:thiamine ABC transporter substrate-binding protein [Actinomycetota bacterium]
MSVRRPTVLLLAMVLALTACSASGQPSNGNATHTVVIATHDSWAMSKNVLADFHRRTGLTVRIEQQGDAGQLTNKLVLTKGNPIADGVFGIDNTFATRAVQHGVLASYHPKAEPASLARFALPKGGGADQLVPIDYGDVCVNVDNVWFDKHRLAPPRTFADLTRPAYKNLFVTPAATTSSPGMAFLVATIGSMGSGWPAYWRKLVANGTEVTPGWTQAYEVDFTAGGSKTGDRPIVLSYSSSPPYTIPQGESRPTTSALLDTCFRQVEYAGVLAGARNASGAQKFIDFMLGREFQAALPENMYVYPADTSVQLPAQWATWAPTASKPVTMSPQTIAAHRDGWLQQWQDIATR